VCEVRSGCDGTLDAPHIGWWQLGEQPWREAIPVSFCDECGRHYDLVAHVCPTS